MNFINSFPLYDNLLKDVELSKGRVNKKSLLKQLNEIDEKHKNTIYLIIKIFSLKHEKVPNLFELPYKGISLTSYTEGQENYQDLSFDVAEFPPKLLKCLDIFCKKYCSIES